MVAAITFTVVTGALWAMMFGSLGYAVVKG
jgi:hypothetical protein